MVNNSQYCKIVTLHSRIYPPKDVQNSTSTEAKKVTTRTTMSAILNWVTGNQFPTVSEYLSPRTYRSDGKKV